MIRLLKAIILHPLGPDWKYLGGNSGSMATPQALFHGLGPTGYDPGRELARIGHQKQRAHIRSVARQIRAETGLPPHPALERAA